MAADKDQYRVTKVTAARKNCTDAAFAVASKLYAEELTSQFDATYKVSIKAKSHLDIVSCRHTL